MRSPYSYLWLPVFALLLSCSQAEQVSAIETPTATTEAASELPPLDYLFAAHYSELRMSAMTSGDRMLGAYLVHDSQPDYLRSGLLLSSEIHKTQLLALSFESCNTELAKPRADDFIIIWDYFRTPPKHFMGRINWTCGEVRSLYRDVAARSEVSLPFFSGRNGHFLKLNAQFPALKTINDIKDWQKFLRKIELEPLGTLAPNTLFKHQNINRKEVLRLQNSQ